MKRLAIALAFLSLSALTALAQEKVVNSGRSNIKNNLGVVSGPDGKVWCSSPVSSKPAPCTESQVARLDKALANSGAKERSKNSSIKNVALAKDGSLMCLTSSGTGPCTAAHLPELKQADARVNNELENATQTPPPQR
jgi:hypothetical protein